ncbi:MAG: hypothetical protein FWF54_04450 [Candidatus Azobacteroides sp.]|nr:hypothetical protein [Candidatus Azobacteroides sp.]
MKKFLLKFIVFAFIGLVMIFILILLPPTPKVSESLLFIDERKDSLLIYVDSPRILFVGGSNLSFGLNSQTIKDSLHLNPINTAVDAAIGLKYMMENTGQYIKKGDIVVLIPEYHYFFTDYNNASEELTRTIFDVNINKIKLLSIDQLLLNFPYLCKLASSKCIPAEYTHVEKSDVYSVHSFNQYGDVYPAYRENRMHFLPYEKITDSFKSEVIQGIRDFERNIYAKEGILLISYPALQDSSYINLEESIKRVENEYRKNGFTILGTPQKYMMPDSLFFNTPYHLNNKGVAVRTKLLIEDISKFLNNR